MYKSMADIAEGALSAVQQDPFSDAAVHDEYQEYNMWW